MKDKMTIKEFLEAGYKFEVGDAFTSVSGIKVTIKTNNEASTANEAEHDDDKRYIIKSAALEREEQGNIFGKVGIEGDEQEWKNGDECVVGIHTATAKFVGYVPGDKDECFITFDGTVAELIYVSLLRKPETKAEREERSRLEAAYDLYCFANGEKFSNYTIEEFSSVVNVRDMYLSLVDKTNYRLEK